MPQFKIIVTETITTTYLVTAVSAQEAQARLAVQAHPEVDCIERSLLSTVALPQPTPLRAQPPLTREGSRDE